jgi:leucyl/phenylalanyl-tRNA--protein transferase
MTIMGAQAPFWLDPRERNSFPDVELAMTEPNGLLAVGGDLSTERLLTAYQAGIFPWYSDGQPILWWSPNPRAVLYLDQLYISRSLNKSLRKNDYVLKNDTAFDQVIEACATARGPTTGTWITAEMAFAYQRLHQEGHAHSIEVWRGRHLVGGLYGIAIGKVFFGESMFSRERDTSKIALAALVKHLGKHNFGFIDCQVASGHLSSLGAVDIPRKDFVEKVAVFSRQQNSQDVWSGFISRNELLDLL